MRSYIVVKQVVRDNHWAFRVNATLFITMLKDPTTGPNPWSDESSSQWFKIILMIRLPHTSVIIFSYFPTKSRNKCLISSFPNGIHGAISLKIELFTTYRCENLKSHYIYTFMSYTVRHICLFIPLKFSVMSSTGVTYFRMKYFSNIVNNEWTGIVKVTE